METLLKQTTSFRDDLLKDLADMEFAMYYSKTYNYLDTVGEVTNLASGGGTELPLSEIASQ